MISQKELKVFKAETLRLLEEASNKVEFDWLKEPGDLVQCPPEALCKGDYYLMGFNPGGRAGGCLRDTIDSLHLDSGSSHALSDAPGNYWRNICKLVDVLDIPPGHLFMTNLFPNCAPHVSEWKKSATNKVFEHVDAIWPLHELMLSRVRPRFVVVSGISAHSAFRLLWEKLRSRSDSEKWDDTMSKVTKEADPQVKSFSVKNLFVHQGKPLPRVTFIGVRHFSWGGPGNPSVVKRFVDHEIGLHGT